MGVESHQEQLVELESESRVQDAWAVVVMGDFNAHLGTLAITVLILRVGTLLNY